MNKSVLRSFKLMAAPVGVFAAVSLLIFLSTSEGIGSLTLALFPTVIAASMTLMSYHELKCEEKVDNQKTSQ